MKVDNIPDDIENARHQGRVPREYFLCLPWVRQIKLFCQYLRNGCLPFQALELSEKNLNNSEVDRQHSSADKSSPKQKSERKTKDLPVESSSKASKDTKISTDVKPCRTANIKKNGTTTTPVKTSENVTTPEKKSTRRRSNRRRHRVVSSDSLNNSFSDASVELNHSNAVKSDSNSNTRRRTDTKEVSYQAENSNVGNSDSGYSDHSDQSSYPDNFNMLTCKCFSHPCDFDSLMTKAILALSQIQVDVAACKA